MFLAAKGMLHLEGKSLAEVERFAPIDLAWMRGWMSKQSKLEPKIGGLMSFGITKQTGRLRGK